MVRIDIELRGSPPVVVPVTVGAGALDGIARAVAPAHRVLLVTDRNVAATPWADAVAELVRDVAGPRLSRHVVPAGEAHKTLWTTSSLWDAWAQDGAGRDAMVVAVGGGVVTDLAGFAAATYLRGIDWVAVPTTVLGMADASLGGKTGVNLAEGKNLVGAFHHPRAVFADVATLGTLGDDVYHEGWAEVVKAAVVGDRHLFEQLERHGRDVAAREPSLTSELLARAMRVKAGVVAADEREAGVREILNFGHTLAHAIEAASGHAVSHGRAVAIGMVAEARLATAHGRLRDGVAERIAAACRDLGLEVGLPRGLSRARLAQAVSVDKKRRRDRLRVALPTGLGAHDPALPCLEVEPDELLAHAR